MTEPTAKRPTAAAHGTVAPRAGVSATELAQKDSLIRALTEQLEQAAEQLDRFQRSGADRKRGPTGGGMPAELVEEQRQAVGDLQRVVQQWEDMQAGLTLGRIEIQLTELRDFVAQRLDGSAMGAPIERHAGLTVHEEPAVFSGSSARHEEKSSASPADTEWERLKTQLLHGDSDAGLSCELRHCAPEEMPEPPPAVDVEHASREELQAAVQARDEFISLVVRRLRATEVTQPMSELVSLGPEAPEFVQRMTELERQLQEHLRLAEVELSLERAKMARDLSQLHQQQELVQKQLKKLGLQSADDVEPGRTPAASNPDRRWARFLGASKGE
ncbi:MAG TPA: hypothetical protein VM165_00530 [Planctomycetaceae bacterium]|nr:hypothetical protein [Planctomycetaceae bacterium]